MTPAPAAPEIPTRSAHASNLSPAKQKLISQIVMVGVSLYIAALGLLALDQTFKWGLFGP